MWFSSRLPLSSVIELCRVLRHYLGAGLTLRDAFRKQAARGMADLDCVPSPAACAAELEKRAAPSKTP